MTPKERRRSILAALLGVAALAVGLLLVPARKSGLLRRPNAERRPNVVVIVTDDQPVDSLPHGPAVMPYLQGRWADPNDHWVVFPNAVVADPLCCPSRASILTGRYPHNTGVLTNADGDRFDESSTIATWLADAGYTTSLVGKYLNGYPFQRGPYVPAGWSSWDGKQQDDETTVYHDFTLVHDGEPVRYGSAAYSTTVFTRLALADLLAAPADRPFFLYLAFTAPHKPWEPAPGDAGAYADLPPPAPPNLWEANVSDKPAWVQALPVPPAGVQEALAADHVRAFEALRAVDRSVRTLLDTLRTRGELEHTVVFFATDNGFSFGEHRWITKSCPYEECVRTPFAVRMPGAAARTDPRPVSLVDLAPTIAELAGVHPSSSVDGRSLAPVLEGPTEVPWPRGRLIESAGNDEIPPWSEIRTDRFAYAEYATGERELYDLRADPAEMRNVAFDPAYATIVARLSARIEELR